PPPLSANLHPSPRFFWRQRLQGQNLTPAVLSPRPALRSTCASRHERLAISLPGTSILGRPKARSASGRERSERNATLLETWGKRHLRLSDRFDGKLALAASTGRSKPRSEVTARGSPA